MTRTLLWVTASLVAVVLSLALAQGMSPDHEAHHGPGPGGETAPGMSMMMSQIESELDFLRQMIVHHQEAIHSARQVLEVAEREEVEGWLHAWYPDEAHETPYRPMMRGFEGLTPHEAERAFTEDMVMHHMMAVRDALHLVMHDLAEHEEVRMLAQEIIGEQAREAGEMNAWLRDVYGVAMPMGQKMPEQLHRHGMTGMGEVIQRCMAMMGQMPMHELMQRCLEMMGEMMPGVIGQAGARYDQEAVEALARAFLAGYRPDAEIVGVEPPRNLYTVTFRVGDRQGRLVVDAETGEVRLETPVE